MLNPPLNRLNPLAPHQLSRLQTPRLRLRRRCCPREFSLTRDTRDTRDTRGTRGTRDTRDTRLKIERSTRRTIFEVVKFGRKSSTQSVPRCGDLD